MLLVAIVAAVFGSLLLAIFDLRSSAGAARRAEEALAAGDRLEKLVLDLETGSRGFVISGRPRSLEPWQEAVGELDAQIGELRRLVRDPAQRERAAALAAAVRAYRDEWSTPLVAQARRDRTAAARREASGRGGELVEALRERFSVFETAEKELARARVARADSAASRAVALGIGGIAGTFLLVAALGAYLSALVVGPVRRVAEAAGRVAGGDLAIRVPEAGAAEIGELGRSFNAMTVALEEGRDALERALADLAAGKERIEALFAFGERLAGEVGPGALAAAILEGAADLAQAEIGTLYVADDESGGHVLAAARGLDPAALPERLDPASGLPARALSERRPAPASYGATGLRLEVFGESVAVRHELHLPLCHADRAIAVLTLARVGDLPFEPAEQEALEHLGDQAAIALANALAYERTLRLLNVNRAVLDATRDGIRLDDLEGRMLLVNGVMERLSAELLGIPAGATAPESLVLERLANPETYLATAKLIEAEPERETLDELELAGSGRVFQRYTAPVRDAADALLGRITVAREITAERESDRLKSELVATVSHELRTPLTGIVGFAELLQNPELAPETRTRYLELLHSEAQRLGALIDDFLDLQRIESGDFTLALEPFDVADVLRRQVTLSSAQGVEHPIGLELRSERLEVVGERERISQVVANLVSNAIKYSPGGGRVTVSGELVEGAVRVAVSDCGLGIPAAQQRHIFERFFRVDSSDTRRIGGTGLGLALCRQIVEAHAGRIGFESVEGEGSTFWLELPAAQARDRGHTRHVLVVEDDAGAAALLQECLGEDGYEIEVVGSGEEALARARDRPPDAICLDIALAGALDGWQVLDELKASPPTAHVPVVVCSGGSGHDRARALGASDFLAKPISPAGLREAVARLVPAGHGSVLVVDDEAPVRRLVVETLAGQGLELRVAAGGAEALAAIAERAPDVVVLDLMMPQVDGFAVLERLQADGRTRALPVIVLTARRLSSEERSLLRSRATALIEKSAYSVAELRRLIERALGT